MNVNLPALTPTSTLSPIKFKLPILTTVLTTKRGPSIESYETFKATKIDEIVLEAEIFLKYGKRIGCSLWSFLEEKRILSYQDHSGYYKLVDSKNLHALEVFHTSLKPYIQKIYNNNGKFSDFPEKPIHLEEESFNKDLRPLVSPSIDAVRTTNIST